MDGWMEGWRGGGSIARDLCFCLRMGSEAFTGWAMDFSERVAWNRAMKKNWETHTLCDAAKVAGW